MQGQLDCVQSTMVVVSDIDPFFLSVREMVWAPAKTLNPMRTSAPPRGSTQANKTNKLTGELLLGFFSGCCLLLLLFLFSSSSSASFLSVFPLFLFCLSVFLIGPSIAVVAVVVASFPHHFFPPSHYSVIRLFLI